VWWLFSSRTLLCISQTSVPWLADIGSGLIDAVVVYKLDRLTRSLADFAKMVEVFDAQGVSFAAVTA
jgi:DNA invertase Pin-like site-specific DNA recombinase